jgi:hypothetical protein
MDFATGVGPGRRTTRRPRRAENGISDILLPVNRESRPGPGAVRADVSKSEASSARR